MSLAIRRFLRVLRLYGAPDQAIAHGNYAKDFHKLSNRSSNATRFSTFVCVRARARRVVTAPHAFKSEAEDTTTNESEAFGTLAEKHGVSVFKLPPELATPSEEEEEERPRRRSRNTPRWYFMQCRKLAKEKKPVECLKFFEEKMLKEDRVFPEETNFTVVMGALGRVGYAKKAFQLYNQMKDRGLRPSVATYSALFNAVAQSPYSSDIRKAVRLYEEVHRKKIRLNRLVYNSAIKAFGRHGTTEQMMGIFRESIIAGFEPDHETFNMILLCLEKDKESGFRHAIEVWRQMIMLGVEPGGKTIIYLLKVLKNCGIGDPDVAYRKLITELPDPTDYKDFFKNHIRNVYWLKGQASTPRTTLNPDLQLPPEPEIITLEPGAVLEETSINDRCSEIEPDERDVESSDVFPPQSGTDDGLGHRLEQTSEESCTAAVTQHADVEILSKADVALRSHSSVPNLLTLPFDKMNNEEHMMLPVELKACKYPTDRLNLIGGYRSILDILEKYDIAPTVMLLSSLVRVIEDDTAAENDVVSYAKQHKVDLDIDFYNMVLRNRAHRRDHGAVQEVLQMIAESGLKPNYRTWCVTALSCVHGKQGVQLMNEVKNTSVVLDHVFYNSLITAALRRRTTKVQGYKGVYGYDYRYLTRIVNEMKESGVKADRQMISLLELASDWPKEYNRWETADQDFEQKVFHFRKVYKEWLDVVEVEEEKKPFHEFRRNKKQG